MLIQLCKLVDGGGLAVTSGYLQITNITHNYGQHQRSNFIIDVNICAIVTANSLSVWKAR